MQSSPIVLGAVVPGLPHPYLCPELNSGWQNINWAFHQLKDHIEQLQVEHLVVYSTLWPSVIGHQIQAQTKAKWILVDELFHQLGSIPYEFSFDAEFAERTVFEAKSRGLQARAIDYQGFPIDTGSVVTLKFLNPDQKMSVSLVSSNVYSDRAETIVLGKACGAAILQSQKRTAVIVVSSLSNRLHERFIAPKEDRISSQKDHEWNLKVLEFLAKGRLEDVSQLSRQIHREARVHKVNNFKAFWWLSAVMGAHNRYTGKVLAYEPVYGAGAAVVELRPAPIASRDLEFDEESPDLYMGERNVLAPEKDYAPNGSSQNGDDDV